MSIINLIKVSHDFGNKLLFEDINMTLDKNTKAGLVGKNGTGKSTLFKIMSGQIKPLRGDVYIAKGYKIGYFAQDFSFSSKETLWEWLYQSRQELVELKREMESLSSQMGLLSDTNEMLTRKYDELQTEFDLLDGFNYENDIKTLLMTFGFYEKDYRRVVDDFSGGEKTRIRLISILLNKYNFILFDEPTNHLDLLTVDWFIKYLKSLDCGYLIVSHDRYLLDQVTNKIYDLNNKQIDTYKGNYSSYEQQAIEKDALLKKQYSLQQKLIKKTEDFIKKNIVRDSTTSRAKSRLKMLNKMEKIELCAKAKDLKINIESLQRSGNDIFRLKDLMIGYSFSKYTQPDSSFVEDKILAQDINLNLHYQDKICLVGANGSGKTTLLKVLNNELEPIAGDLWTGYNISVGYFDQLHIKLDEDQTVLETIWSLMPYETYGTVMSYLGRFGFNEINVEQKVSSLSGGEKSRIYLAQLIFEKPNLLILDEPTNHLDISMIKALEKALKNYDGTLILVSHDRYFIQAVTNTYWVIKDKNINQYQESFESILQRINPYDPEKKIKVKTTQIETTEKKIKKTNPYVFQKLLEKISSLEEDIKIKENEIVDIQNRFSESEFYTNKTNILNANNKINELKADIEILKMRKDGLEVEYLEKYDN